MKEPPAEHVREMNTHLNPPLCRKKLGLAPIFSYFLFQNIDCGYALEPPRRGRRFKRVPTIYVLEQNKK